MKNITNLRAVIEEIKETKGSIAKASILKREMNNEDLMKIFKFVYNNQVVTGLARKKLEKKILPLPENKFDNIFDLMQYVKDNPTGKIHIVQHVHSFMELLSEKDQQFVHDVLIKDFPIGISKNSLNKVYGEDFLEVYGVQNAATYNPKVGIPKGEKFYLSYKSDGNRVTFHKKKDGSHFIKTRANKDLDGFIELDKVMKNLPSNYSYDGEIVTVESEYGKMEYFNDVQSICRSKGGKVGVKFLVFDMIPLDEFDKGESTQTFEERRNFLELTLEGHKNDFIVPMPIIYSGTDQSKIEELSEAILERGYEGTMINIASATMKRGRDARLLKNKPFKTIDLRVIDVVEDIRGGKCGSIKVDYKGYDVNVSGLKNPQKVSWWEDPSLIVGSIIEVKYLHETTNAHGTVSLRHPSLLRIRDDKDEVSYS